MRLLNRNLSLCYYAQFLGKTPVLDDDGYETGEYETRYSAKVPLYANIAPATGRVRREWYGLVGDYDKVIALCDNPLTETSVLWIDDLNAAEPDYCVKRVATSLNSTQVLVGKIV